MNNHIFQQELVSGERLIWTGQPNAFVLFTKEDIFLVPFTFLWFGGASSMFIPLLTNPTTLFQELPFSLFPLFFIFIGFYMAIGRFIYKILKKKQTYYAITDKRAIIYSNFLGKSVEGIYFNSISTINKTIGSNGRGTIIFGNTNTASYNNTGLDIFGKTTLSPAFYDIDEAKIVYQRITELKKSEDSNAN